VHAVCTAATWERPHSSPAFHLQFGGFAGSAVTITKALRAKGYDVVAVSLAGTMDSSLSVRSLAGSCVVDWLVCGWLARVSLTVVSILPPPPSLYSVQLRDGTSDGDWGAVSGGGGAGGASGGAGSGTSSPSALASVYAARASGGGSAAALGGPTGGECLLLATRAVCLTPPHSYPPLNHECRCGGQLVRVAQRQEAHGRADPSHNVLAGVIGLGASMMCN